MGDRQTKEPSMCNRRFVFLQHITEEVKENHQEVPSPVIFFIPGHKESLLDPNLVGSPGSGFLGGHTNGYATIHCATIKCSPWV